MVPQKSYSGIGEIFPIFWEILMADASLSDWGGVLGTMSVQGTVDNLAVSAAFDNPAERSSNPDSVGHCHQP